MSFRSLAAAVLVLVLSACASRHPPSRQAVFLIESKGGSLSLIPPALPGGVTAKPVPFPQILTNEYGYNPWEQYVDLSPGMRLAVQTEATASVFLITRSHGGRNTLRPETPAADRFQKTAMNLRFFYQTKYTKVSGQPVRPAMVLWSDSAERLKIRTAEAHENPDFSGEAPNSDCLTFHNRTTASPELRITVNQMPRYVTLGWTVRDVLHADHVTAYPGLRMRRRYRNHMVSVNWTQSRDALPLPLVAGDELGW